MSVFQSIDVRGPQERRKRLLQRVLQRAGGAQPNAGWVGPPDDRFAGVMGRMGSVFSAGRPVHSVGDMQPAVRPRVTQMERVIPPALLALLGGAAPRALPGEVSQGMGAPIDIPGRGTGVGSPPPAPPVDLSTPANAPLSSGSVYSSPQAAQVATASAAGPSGSVVSPEQASPVNAAETQGLTSGAVVPLGGGLVYDPVTDRVILGRSQI